MAVRSQKKPVRVSIQLACCLQIVSLECLLRSRKTDWANEPWFSQLRHALPINTGPYRLSMDHIFTWSS
jgi:hypothetical protein